MSGGRRLLLVLLVWLLIALVSYGAALRSASASLEVELTARFPDGVLAAAPYATAHGELSAFMRARLLGDLAALPVADGLPLLRQCGVRKLASGSPSPWKAMIPGVIALPWRISQADEQLQLGLHCAPAWPVLLPCSGLLALLLTAIALLLPRPLDEQARRWLAVGLEQGDDLGAALAIACAAPTLEFRSKEYAVVCHGCKITLPSTPFLYYRWYAMRRRDAEDDGWYSNPPSTGADPVAAASMLALMHACGAHPKAQRELAERGLRAKVLDQNRSKVKEELVRILGPELAQPFLFEVARDARTARYRYRLCLQPALLLLDDV